MRTFFGVAVLAIAAYYAGTKQLSEAQTLLLIGILAQLSFKEEL